MKHKLITSSVRERVGDFAPAFVSYTEDVLFGDVWRRSELSLRERSLITVSALVAGEHGGQLPYHLNLVPRITDYRKKNWSRSSLSLPFM